MRLFLRSSPEIMPPDLALLSDCRRDNLHSTMPWGLSLLGVLPQFRELASSFGHVLLRSARCSSTGVPPSSATKTVMHCIGLGVQTLLRVARATSTTTARFTCGLAFAQLRPYCRSVRTGRAGAWRLVVTQWPRSTRPHRRILTWSIHFATAPPCTLPPGINVRWLGQEPQRDLPRPFPA